ncbi:hypothetical protein ACTXIU_13255, partial [Glutamicibacter arilaitensis]
MTAPSPLTRFGRTALAAAIVAGASIPVTSAAAMAATEGQDTIPRVESLKVKSVATAKPAAEPTVAPEPEPTVAPE